MSHQSTHSPSDHGDWGPLSALPGNPLMWVLIASELLVFGAGLIGYAGARVLNPVLFMESQATLDRLAGTINTAILLTSGLFAALALEAAKQQSLRVVRAYLALAALLGLVFLIVKGMEYTAEIQAGHTIDTNTFFTLYYLITGFHALHVIAGMIILAIIAIWPSMDNLETGTAFWHMVDMVWILVFPCLYLLR